MLRNMELYKFLCEKNQKLTEEWYEALDKKQNGIYSSTNTKVIEKLKRQNREFHDQFCLMFNDNHEDCQGNFQKWILHTAKDEDRLTTPIPAILKDFFLIQSQYLQLIEEFVTTRKEVVSNEQVAVWNQCITSTINDVLVEFTDQNSKAAARRQDAQQALIVEMSAPVILLTQNTGLLPLVGEINTHRAHVIFEKTLEQSYQYRLERLFIDLSGVPIIDTMVAQQIFQLIAGLKIIGVETALSGISPDIAQTAIQLGIDFREIEVYNTLTQAIKLKDLFVD